MKLVRYRFYKINTLVGLNYQHEIPTRCRTLIANDHWGFHMTKKAGFSLRTKNEHMKSPRTGVHPVHMIIWGFHVTIENSRL